MSKDQVYAKRLAWGGAPSPMASRSLFGHLKKSTKVALMVDEALYAAAHSVPKVLLCLHYPPLPHNRVSAANFDCPYSFVWLVGWDCVASARRGLAAAP